MAKKLIQQRLLDEYFQDDMAPSGKLYEHKEEHIYIRVYVLLNIYGMELDYRQETGSMDLDYGQVPQQTLHRKTTFISAEAVRKLFGADNYLEMIERIKERFQGPSVYDDLLNYLRENKII